MKYFEQIKNRIREQIDKCISDLSDFLSEKETYIISCNGDPLKTDKVWFIELREKNMTSKFVISCVIDSGEEVARYILHRYVLLLQSFGYSIVDEVGEEFDFSEKDIDTMIEFSEFFKNNSSVTIENDYDNDCFNIICSNKNDGTVFASVKDISARGSWVITKQLVIMMAGLGKFVKTSDNTIGNKYGIVEFIPNNEKNQ